MRKSFSLFQSHLDLAHQYWSKILSKGDLAIDATCGNGHDTIYLVSLGAKVYTIDVQEEALNQAKQNAENESLVDHITFIEGCHSKFPCEISPESVKLVVYNLGYLPGGNKGITTKVSSTLQSVEEALSLLVPGGMISITCYPGHKEGDREEESLLEFSRQLDPREWSCCHHRWTNRKRSPSLLILQKAH